MSEGFGSGGYRFDGDDRRDYDDFSDDFDDDYDDGYFGRGGLSDDFDDDFDDDDDYRSRRGRSGRSRSQGARGGSPERSRVSRINYDDFEDKGYYRFGDDSGRRSSGNVIPDRRRREAPRPAARPARANDTPYDDNRRRRKRSEVASRVAGNYYDNQPVNDGYDDDAYYDDDGYFDDGGYYGRDRAPADRTPEAIPPIYAKYLGNGGQYYEEHYGKTAKKNNAVSLSSYRARKRLKAAGIVLGSVAVISLLMYYFMLVHIYHPVPIDNSIVNLQTADATTMLRSVIGTRLSDKTIYFVVNGETFSLNLGEYGFNYSSDADGSTNTTTDTDADGKEVKTTIATYKNICYNQTKLEALLDSVSDKYGKTMIKPSYTIEGDQLVIKSGTDGIGIDENSLMAEILERIKQGNYDERLMEEMVTTEAPAVDIDKIYKEVVCDVKDASSYVDENGETIYSSDVVGKKFNLDDARAKIEGGGNTWSITLKLTQPKVTLVELKAPTCPDLLAETTTEFKATNKTRAANIKNAARRINTYGEFEDGFVMAPGEIFSFNDTVGERTEANGFSIATVYTNTGTTNDVGGGICQVSSAIFSAAFKADLEIVNRTNHMYKVHYGNVGEDATVNWGTLDFKFQNSKTYPIKIKMIYASKGGTGTITCQIWGTNDGYRCEFDNKTTQIVKTSTVEKKAVTGKPRGTIEWGDPGLTVEIYRVRYKDDVKISKELYATSIYQPLATVKYV